jgi:hypothetical protein
MTLYTKKNNNSNFRSVNYNILMFVFMLACRLFSCLWLSVAYMPMIVLMMVGAVCCAVLWL